MRVPEQVSESEDRNHFSMKHWSPDPTDAGLLENLGSIHAQEVIHQLLQGVLRFEHALDLADHVHHSGYGPEASHHLLSLAIGRVSRLGLPSRHLIPIFIDPGGLGSGLGM